MYVLYRRRFGVDYLVIVSNKIFLFLFQHYFRTIFKTNSLVKEKGIYYFFPVINNICQFFSYTNFCFILYFTFIVIFFEMPSLEYTLETKNADRKASQSRCPGLNRSVSLLSVPFRLGQMVELPDSSSVWLS